jgi:hypothetical protein
MISVSLRQTQREELTSLSHQAIGRVALRAHMLLLSDRGFTVPETCADLCLWTRRRTHLAAPL